MEAEERTIDWRGGDIGTEEYHVYPVTTDVEDIWHIMDLNVPMEVVKMPIEECALCKVGECTQMKKTFPEGPVTVHARLRQ